MDSLKRLKTELARGPAPKRPTKANRTLSLLEPQYTDFAAACRRMGWYPSDVVDRLIAMFLETELEETRLAAEAARTDAEVARRPAPQRRYSDPDDPAPAPPWKGPGKPRGSDGED